MKIDSHQHVWYYDPVKHSWIDEEMAVIRRDFVPADLEPLLRAGGFDGCIAVQADQTAAETEFLLQLSIKNHFIKGVVGWVDLQADNIHEWLEHYSNFSNIKGFRHVLQAEEPGFMLQDHFLRGIAALQSFNFTYDVLVFPEHLPATLQLVRRFPEQPFVIDHIAKPYIKAGLIDEWKRDIKAMAACENVYCKISGMVTEADYKQWTPEQFTPYLDAVVQAFGTKRIMYGSDWPVCLVAASYEAMLGIVERYFSAFTEAEQEDFFGNNATRFYHL